MKRLFVFWILFSAFVGLGISSCPTKPSSNSDNPLSSVDSKNTESENFIPDNSTSAPTSDSNKEVHSESVNDSCSMSISQARSLLRQKCLEEKDNTSRACMNELTLMAEKAFSKHPLCKTNSANGGVNHEVLMCIMQRESKKDSNGDYITGDCESKKVTYKTKSGKSKTKIIRSPGCGIVQMTGDGVRTAARVFQSAKDPAKSCLRDLQRELGENTWDSDFLKSISGNKQYLAESRNAALALQAAHVCTNIVERRAFTPCENGKYYYGHDPKKKGEMAKIDNYCSQIESCTKDLAGIETSQHAKREEFAQIRTSWLNEIKKIAGGDKCDFDNEMLTASLKTERNDTKNNIRSADDGEKRAM